MGRKTQKQISPQKSRDNPVKILFTCFFLYVFFCSPFFGVFVSLVFLLLGFFLVFLSLFYLFSRIFNALGGEEAPWCFWGFPWYFVFSKRPKGKEGQTLNKGQSFFSINFWAPTQTPPTPNPMLGPQKKSLCASFPGKERKEGTHINFFGGSLGSNKFGRQKVSLSLPVCPGFCPEVCRVLFTFANGV